MIPEQPLQFKPLFRSYLWGGRRLEMLLKKPIPSSGIWAESWEIVDHGSDQSEVTDGPWMGWTLRQLIESFPTEILGSNAAPGSVFPLLLKYLDCQRVLSVQVHPDDDYAKKLDPPDLGKTEAWYVLESDPESVLYAGLKPGVGPDELKKALNDGRMEDCLHAFRPEKGDCVFIPAGTVHALGEGLVVAEIQQASDTTFRLFDWNRTGNDGKPRPLHITQAMETIDFQRGPVDPIRIVGKDHENVVLCECSKFRLTRWKVSGTLALNNSFAIATVVQGEAKVVHGKSSTDLPYAESILIPAACQYVQLELSEDATVLVATLP